MNLFKRCPCPQPSQCDHPSTGTDSDSTAKNAGAVPAARTRPSPAIAAVRQAAVLEGREGIRRDRGVKLSEHIKAYVAYTTKTNRTSYKDEDVLARPRGVSDQPAEGNLAVPSRAVEIESREGVSVSPRSIGS